MATRRRILAAVTALAVVGGLVSACGSSSKPQATSPSTASGLTTSTLFPAGSQGGLSSASFGGGFGLGPPTSVGCQQSPPSIGPAPAWLPSDLPLPTGTVFVNQLADVGAYHRALFVTVGTTDFVRYALAQWPPKGWTLGRGDAERGEAEDSFAKTGYGGAFRVRAAYCDVGRSELLIVFGSTSAVATTAPPTSAG
ncbi:MAG: hypothetical protein JWO37_3839 [Acidimicrobiales bacterium]|jgi:hypothetical protein|nr:hypothetical protein [Acidimicrobiales bacterium]